MKYSKHIIYIGLYFANLFLDMSITKSALTQFRPCKNKECRFLMSKYLLSLTKILLIMEIGFYSGFYFIRKITYRLQIMVCRCFSLIFVIFIGILIKDVTKIVISIILHCVTLIFLMLSMNQANDVLYHLYNKRAGVDFLEFKLYIIDEMINTGKKTSLICATFLIMRDICLHEQNELQLFHIFNFIGLVVDYFLCNSRIDRKNIYYFSYIILGVIWITGVSALILFLFFFNVISLIIVFLMEFCFTLIMVFFLIRLNITTQIKERNEINNSLQMPSEC
ncbi:uncharacterized protein VNE69_06154 [Vairimorpha necatrix]|uniref:Membrane protein n=1 Tax=Vairimorpha necatrix TaxID=6039 RepID=A0AAX4JCZ5_9MICR